MKKQLLFVALWAALPAIAQSEPDIEHSDFYIMGGALRGLSETTWTAQSGFSFGAGPYVAYDGAREQQLNLTGILSLRAAYRFAETRRHTFEAGFMYTRVASFYNRDQDIFMLGLRLAGRVGQR